MKSFAAVLLFAASCSAAPQAQLPAGLSALACPDYPYCGARGGWLEVPNVPGAAEVIAAQEALIRAGLNPAAGLPGYEAHAAAEAAVKEASREGFPAHAAAEAAVLLAQGLAPAGTDPAFFAHYQAEQAVRNAELQLLVSQG